MFEESKVQKAKKRRKFDQIIKKKKKIQANHQQKDYQQPNQHYQQMNPKTDCKSYPKTEMTISMEERIFFLNFVDLRYQRKQKNIQANHQQKDYQQPNQHYQQTNPKTNCKSYRLRSYRYVAAKKT